MTSTPAEPADASPHDEDGTDSAAESHTPEPAVEDDGSVPEKQLSRWKGEGGPPAPE